MRGPGLGPGPGPGRRLAGCWVRGGQCFAKVFDGWFFSGCELIHHWAIVELTTL